MGLRYSQYILESPSFILDEDTPLTFDVYRKSNAVTLKVLNFLQISLSTEKS